MSIILREAIASVFDHPEDANKVDEAVQAIRAALSSERQESGEQPLTFDPDIARSLPGGELDLATYEAVEAALDRAEAPMQGGKRWLTLPERIDALAATPSQESGEREGWQPIETAPKDGTVILIARGPKDATFPFVEAAYWSQCVRAFGGCKKYPWVTLDKTNGVNGRTEDSPTHWMPLPPSPSLNSGGQNG